MNDERAVPDEGDELVGDLGEERLVGKKFLAQPMDVESGRRHVPFGIDIDVEALAGRDVVLELDAADLHEPMPVLRIEAGGFGIENDFTHRVTLQTRGRGSAARRRGGRLP